MEIEVGVKKELFDSDKRMALAFMEIGGSGIHTLDRDTYFPKILVTGLPVGGPTKRNFHSLAVFLANILPP
jgi:hypothetical protein